MKEVLQIANEMRDADIIGEYIIGGSVAIIYYTGPIDTDDLDLFFLHGKQSSEIFQMSEIYNFLRKKGYKVEGINILIGGVKVQFIPSTDSISDEAIKTSRSVTLFGVSTKVPEVEYIIAMKLKAARAKDFTHIVHLLQHSKEKIDMAKISDFLKKFNLESKWNKVLGMLLWDKD